MTGKHRRGRSRLISAEKQEGAGREKGVGGRDRNEKKLLCVYWADGGVGGTDRCFGWTTNEACSGWKSVKLIKTPVWPDKLDSQSLPGYLWAWLRLLMMWTWEPEKSRGGMSAHLQLNELVVGCRRSKHCRKRRTLRRVKQPFSAAGPNMSALSKWLRSADRLE